MSSIDEKLDADEKEDASKSKDFESFHAMRQRRRANQKSKDKDESKGTLPATETTSSTTAKPVSMIRQIIASLRESIGVFVESESFQKVIIILIILDVCTTIMLLFIEARVFAKSYALEIAGWFFIYFPAVVLLMFAAEVLLVFIAFGFVFHLGYLTDVAVVGICLVVDVSPTHWRGIRLLGVLRLWRIIRLVNTVIGRIQARIDVLEDALASEKARSSELEIAKSRAEDKERGTMTTVTDLTQTIREQVLKIETLQEALNIAAQNWAEAVAMTEGAYPDALLSNEDLAEAIAEAEATPTERYAIDKKGVFRAVS